MFGLSRSVYSRTQITSLEQFLSVGLKQITIMQSVFTRGRMKFEISGCEQVELQELELTVKDVLGTFCRHCQTLDCGAQ